MLQRHGKGMLNLGVWLQDWVRLQRIDEGRYNDRKIYRDQVVEPAAGAVQFQVNTKFFMRLTPGCMFEILVRRFGTTAGECQMPGPRIAIVAGALDEQEFRSEPAGTGHKGYRSLPLPPSRSGYHRSVCCRRRIDGIDCHLSRSSEFSIKTDNTIVSTGT